MKVGIQQSVLLKALQKGSAAAISEVAEPDAANSTFFTKTIRLSANMQSFMVESNSSLVDIRYSTKVGEDYGIIVKEEGAFLVPAKELIDWVKIQGTDTTISLTLSKLDTPEIINSVKGGDDDQFSVRKIGTLTMLSKDTKKTGNKWSLDCYDSNQVKYVDFNDKTNHCFDMTAKELSSALKMVSFAVLSHKDPDHVLDNVSIQTYQDKLFFSGTDTKVCAMYRADNISNKESQEAILVPLTLIDLASKISDDDNTLSLSHNPGISRLFINQPNLDIRIITANKDQTSEFPRVNMLLETSFELLTEIEAADLKRLLIAASLVNNSSVLFSFKKDEPNMIIKAVSESNKYKPNVSQMSITSSVRDLNAVWGVKHFLNILKAMSDETVKISVHEKSNAVKIMGKVSDNFMCFGMSVKNPIYSN